MATLRSYADVFRQLEACQARYVVVGSLAVVLHGYARPVADLDLVIDGAPVESDRVLRALQACGFMPSLPLPLSLLSVARMLDSRGREVDVFLRFQIPFDRLREDALMVGANDITIPVISRDHLIQMKRMTMREEDERDIEGLLAAAECGKNAAGKQEDPGPSD